MRDHLDHILERDIRFLEGHLEYLGHLAIALLHKYLHLFGYMMQSFIFDGAQLCLMALLLFGVSRLELGKLPLLTLQMLIGLPLGRLKRFFMQEQLPVPLFPKLTQLVDLGGDQVERSILTGFEGFSMNRHLGKGILFGLSHFSLILLEFGKGSALQILELELLALHGIFTVGYLFLKIPLELFKAQVKVIQTLLDTGKLGDFSLHHRHTLLHLGSSALQLCQGGLVGNQDLL